MTDRIVSLPDVAEEWIRATGDANGPEFITRLVAFAEARGYPIVPGWRGRPSILAEQADSLISERIEMKQQQQAAEARRIAEANAQNELNLRQGGIVVQTFGPTTGRMMRGADGVTRNAVDDAVVRNAVR